MNTFPEANLKKRLTNKKEWIICVLIILLGAILRIHSYDSIPKHGWQHDEYAFAWSGMSLIKDHVPSSWSWLGAYGDFPIEKWKGDDYRIVTPWFDHPPLFGLIVGMAAILGGENSFFEVSLTYIRIPSLILGIASILLVYILARKLYGTGVAVLSSLIFATNPTIVFLSRVAVSENLILFLSLATILSILRFFKTSNNFYLYLSAFLAGIASITKITGIFLVLFLFSFLIYKKKWKEGVIAIVIGLLIFSTYFIYGWIYDFKLFMSVLLGHSARFNNIIILDKIFFQKLIPLPFIDMWSIFGWLVLIPVAWQKKTKIISLPIIAYIFVLLIVGAQGHFYPWYAIPFFPFLSLALGIFLYRFLKNPDFLSACLILFFIGGWCLNYVFVNPNISIIPLSFSIFKYLFASFIFIMMAAFFYHYVMPSKKTKILTNMLTIFLMALFIVSNIIIIFNLHKFPGVIN